MGAPFDQSGTSSNFFPSLYTTSSAPALSPGCKVALSATGTCSTANLVAINPLNNSQTYYALQEPSCRAPANIVDGMHYNSSGAYWSYPEINYVRASVLPGIPQGMGKLPFERRPVCSLTDSIQIPVSGRAGCLHASCVLRRVSSLSSLGTSRRFFHPQQVLYFDSNMPAQRLYSTKFFNPAAAWFPQP